MKFSSVILVFCTLFIQEINAQDFKVDWENFTSEKYIIAFNSEVTTYYGTDTVGELLFTLASDTSKTVVLFVFKRNKTMEEFDTLLGNDDAYFSCVRLSNGKTSYIFYKQFTYFVSPWQSCESANDKGFNELPEELFEFILKK